jgi:hypothetical protein
MGLFLGAAVAAVCALATASFPLKNQEQQSCVATIFIIWLVIFIILNITVGYIIILVVIVENATPCHKDSLLVYPS